MSKKWYNYFVSVEGEGAGEERPEGEESTDSASAGAPAGSRSAAQAVADIAASVQPTPSFTPATVAAASDSFEDVYKAAEIGAPPHGFTVYKVADLLQSPHVKNLPPEIKRSSVLLALEAAGVKIQEIIEDAVRRDKALDAFERVRRKSVDDLEAKKTDENRQIQAEIDRLIAEHRARIQANSEAITKERGRFNTWLSAKQKEEQKIADTVGLFVSENPVTVGTASDPAKPKLHSAD